MPVAVAEQQPAQREPLNGWTQTRAAQPRLNFRDLRRALGGLIAQFDRTVETRSRRLMSHSVATGEHHSLPIPTIAFFSRRQRPPPVKRNGGRCNISKEAAKDWLMMRRLEPILCADIDRRRMLGASVRALRRSLACRRPRQGRHVRGVFAGPVAVGAGRRRLARDLRRGDRRTCAGPVGLDEAARAGRVHHLDSRLSRRRRDEWSRRARPRRRRGTRGAAAVGRRPATAFQARSSSPFWASRAISERRPAAPTRCASWRRSPGRAIAPKPSSRNSSPRS